MAWRHLLDSSHRCVTWRGVIERYANSGSEPQTRKTERLLLRIERSGVPGYLAEI